jgi:hypothetical protein
LREETAADRGTKRLIDRMFVQVGNGFYVHAALRVKNGKGISGKQVTFYYSDHGGQRHEREMSVLAFIHGVVRHIPPRQFKIVRYYGLYAPRKASAMRELLKEIGKVVGRVKRRLSWRERIQRGFQRDPLTCSRCGS